MEKIQLNINDIPKYLIGSKLYNILLSNKIQNIKIFSKHYKETTKVNSLDDLKHLMIVLEQWTVTDTPYDIYQFIENNKDLNYDDIYESFPNMILIDEIDLMLIAYSHDIENTSECIVKYSIYNNYINLLKYMRSNGYLWNENTFKYATKNGHLNIFKYLHENKCPWYKYTCEKLAEYGHLE